MRKLPGLITWEMPKKLDESQDSSPRWLISPRGSNRPGTPASIAHSVGWEKLFVGTDSFEYVSQEETD